jgi:hypothetical protein
MRSGLKGAHRYLDIFFDGLRIECKSVKQISGELVVGRRKAAGLPDRYYGELVKDLFRAMGSNKSEALANVKKLRWVFDGSSLPAHIDEAHIAKKLKSYLNRTMFENYPYLDDIKLALDDIIEIWPSHL